MVQVDLDNNHVSTALSSGDFFITPEVVKTTQSKTLVPESATLDQPITKIVSDADYSYVSTEKIGEIVKIDNTDGSIQWRVEPSALGSNIKNLNIISTGILATDGSSIVSISSSGNVSWSGSLNSNTTDTAVGMAETPDGNIITDGKLFDSDGNSLGTFSTANADGTISGLSTIVSNNNGTFAIRIDSYNESSKGQHEIYIRKFDATDSASLGTVEFENSLTRTSGSSQIQGGESPTDNILYHSDLFFNNIGNIAVSHHSEGKHENSFTDPNVTYTAFIGLDGSVLSSFSRNLIGFSQDPNGSYYGVENSKIKKYDSASLSSTVREISITNDKFALISVDKHINSNDQKEVVIRNYATPTTQDATYKLNISGEGAVTVDGVIVIPSGTTTTIELYVDDGVRIEGSCFISGVQVK